MEISDAQILSAFKNPSTREEGFKWLMLKYQRRLYGQIRRMVVLHEDADDVLQNVFIKVWKNLGTFREQSQLHTWLYRIAANEALTFLERNKKRGTAPVEEALNTAADPFFDAEDARQKLQRALDALPVKQRQVFLLRYYDEMPYEEMSEVLQTSVGALKASYHFAVKKIETFLTGD